MANTLEPIVLAALQSAWASASEDLKARLIAAESQILEYSRNLVTNPDVDVRSQQTLIAHKRAEVYATTFTAFHQGLFPAEAAGVSEAIVTYLRAHSVCTVFPGTCITTYGPTLVLGTTASIVYT